MSYERANGYNYDAVKIFMPAGSKQPVYAHYVEHCPPDVAAAFIWLKNRDPERWRDAQQVEHAIGKYSPEDLDHDFFWRYAKCLPERGRIGIFNRSYYEEVLVVRVHNHILKLQKLPPQLLSKSIWDERLYDIAHFEDYLTRQGTIILKFFLHLSRKEQKKRFMERLDRPDKRWKFSGSDVQERKFWGDYMHAFEEAIRATASNRAPWYVVPADNKWFTRLLVAAAIVEAVEKLDLAYPTVDAKKKTELQTARAALSREK